MKCSNEWCKTVLQRHWQFCPTCGRKVTQAKIPWTDPLFCQRIAHPEVDEKPVNDQ